MRSHDIGTSQESRNDRIGHPLPELIPSVRLSRSEQCHACHATHAEGLAGTNAGNRAVRIAELLEDTLRPVALIGQLMFVGSAVEDRDVLCFVDREILPLA